jgi:dTDP-4-amino-4,6-dideoxygalactose transaminase
MKVQLKDLAVFGGEPLFKDAVHVGRPNIGDRQRLLQRINDILDRRWLTNQGHYVKEFENRLTDLLGVKHCIPMCNGTVALEIAIRALGLSGEVILPSFTFVATAHALQWQEITPVFCDIDPTSCNIDPSKIENLITAKTTGIIGVHLWGRPCDIQPLTSIAEKHGLKLLFDAAHALGCSYRGRMIGGFGHAEVLSFHGTKFLNTFEGGAVVTNDDALASKVRLMKNFGFSAKGYDDVVYVGTNGKMNEVSAAMGLTGLESLESFVAANRRNYMQYCADLHGVPGVTVVKYDDREKCNYQYIVLIVDDSTAKIGRDELITILHAENILARRYFYPGCHRMEPYRSSSRYAGLSLPNTDRLAKCVLLLPIGTGIQESEITGITQLLKLIIGNGAEAGRRLEAKLSVVQEER